MYTGKSLGGLIASVVFIVVALVLLSVFLRKKPDRVKNIPLMVIGVLLVAMEVWKISYIAISETPFPLNRLPLYMCSMFLWACPLAAFSKGAVRKYSLAFCYHMGLFSGGAALIIPTDIIGATPGWLPLSENLLPLHSYFYHALLIIFGFWIVIGGFFRPTLKSTLRAAAMIAVILTASLIINLILETGFSHMTASEENLFYGLTQILTYPGYLIAIYILVAGGVPFVFYGFYLLAASVRLLFKKSARQA